MSEKFNFRYSKLINRITLLFFVLITNFAHAQETFYWFGGQGLWSDIEHWSLTSGNSGSVLAPRVPTINDNVVFDDNSFPNPGQRNVNISADSYARDFLVLTSATATAPNFLGSGALTISGDFLLQPEVIWSRSGSSPKLNFSMSKNVTVNTAGISIGEDVTVSGSGFTFDLASNFRTARTLNVTNGVVFNTNDFALHVDRFSKNSTATVNLGSSEISAVQWNASGLVNAGTSHITIRQGTGSRFTSSGTPSTYHNVTFTATTADLSALNAVFQDLVFENTGVFGITRNHTFQNLTLAPGSVYTFARNTTQTITGILTAITPDCTGLMELQAVAGTTAAPVFNVTSGGAVSIPNARITGMHASGATLNVIGINNGGNTGTWNFIQPPAKTMYWVGDALDGDWNNQQNWAATSGGVGGYCVPTQYDNVIFDTNSDASVAVKILPNQIGYCHDITVTGWTGGNLTITGNQLEIYGASTWKNGMTYTVNNTYYRSSDPNEPLVFDGVEHNSTTYFWGDGGWVFQDDFTIDGGSTRSVYLNQGTLNTNSQAVYLNGSFHSASNDPGANALQKTLILGASEINVQTFRPKSNALEAAFTLDAGTSHIIVRSGGTQSSPAFEPLNNQTYWNVTLQGANSFVYGNNITFNNVVFEQGGTFMTGTKTYNNLTLADSKVYNFLENSNQIVNGVFHSNTPDCSGMTEFRGVGSNVYITHTAGALHVPNVLMENIKAAGATPFTATGVDAGGNIGWTFSSPTPKDLYWIGPVGAGGTGNWNDGANWTLNADGTPSGGCIPTQYDNVFFNQHSGSNGLTVTIAGTPAYAHDITWLPGAPTGATLLAPNATIELSIYGSYTMGQNMTHRVKTFFLSDDAGETITFNGSQFYFYNATFNGNGGWQFQDDAYFYATQTGATDLIFTKGTLDFGGHHVFLSGFSSSGGQLRHLNIEGAQIVVKRANSPTLTPQNATNWSYYGSNVTLNAVSSDIKLAGTFRSATGLQWNDLTVTRTTNNSTMFVRGNGNSTSGLGALFNHVRFEYDVTILANNTFNVFEIAQTQRTVTLSPGTTQTVNEMVYLSGTPCHPNTLTANATAYFNVLTGNDEFDYVAVRNINATGGQHLTFHHNSTDNDGNSNMTFLTGSGGLVGLGEDWLCHEMDLTNPDSFILEASGFFGGADTTYSWKKLNDPNHPDVLGTGSTLDISGFGYGTYQITVNYGPSGCVVTDEILVEPLPDLPIVSDVDQTFCEDENATLADLDVTADTGHTILWYADVDKTMPLPPTTPVADGVTYYATQVSSSGCESHTIAVTVHIEINCYCTKPGDFSSQGLPTQVGITVQQKQADWPESIPNGFITLESKTKGFVITRVQNSDVITDVKEGMLIYDIDAACVKLYNGMIWNCIERTCNE